MRFVFLILLLSYNGLILMGQQSSERLLDSLYYYDYYHIPGSLHNVRREIYKYDSDGNQLIQSIYYRSSDTSEWRPSTQNVYAYDSVGQRTEHSLMHWDTIENDWVKTPVFCELSCNGGHWKYKYDSHGNLVETVFDGNIDSVTNEWITGIGSRRTTYDFDSRDQNTGEQWYFWNLDSLLWTEYQRSVIVLDQDGRRTGWSVYRWQDYSNRWEGEFSYEWTYASSGDLIEEKQYSWDRTTQDWKNRNWHLYYYDGAGNRTDDRWFVWDSESLDWKRQIHTVNEFDSTGFQTEMIKYRWAAGIGDSIPWIRSTYESGPDGLLTKRYEYNWDTDNKDWAPELKYVTEYFANGLIYSREIHRWITDSSGWVKGHHEKWEYDTTANKSKILFRLLDKDTQEWQLKWEKISYWSDYSLHADDLQRNPVDSKSSGERLVLYPNPASGTVHLLYPYQNDSEAILELMDLSGKVVLRNIGPINRFDVSGFQKGIYLVRISCEKSFQVQKLIIQ